MTSSVLVGLAVTPRDDEFLNTAKFDNVSTTATGPASAPSGGGSQFAAGLLLATRTGDAVSGRFRLDQGVLGSVSAARQLGDRVSSPSNATQSAQQRYLGGVRGESASGDRHALIDRTLVGLEFDAAGRRLEDGILDDLGWSTRPRSLLAPVARLVARRAAPDGE
jgi:hypothetical protein